MYTYVYTYTHTYTRDCRPKHFGSLHFCPSTVEFAPVTQMVPTSPGDHDLNTMLLHHEDNGIIAREEEPQVTLTKTPAQKAWPILQRYLGECRQAGLDQAASHIQKCIKIHMMTKWAQEANVEPPPLVDSSSDDSISDDSSSDDSSSDDIPLDERCRAVASRLETVLASTDGLGMVPKSCISKDAVLQEGGRVARSRSRRFDAA